MGWKAARMSRYCFVSVNGPVPPVLSLNVPEIVDPETVAVNDPTTCCVVGSVAVSENVPLAETVPVADAVLVLVLPFDVVVRFPLKEPSVPSVVMTSVQLLGKPSLCVPLLT